ncbi:MAG: cytochrome c biogenesis protein ResB [Verrucomicrobiae bacterium]|nr:cytochrome c biogenesis protein ResB [Verrucomicrobiae bacterium]
MNGWLASLARLCGSLKTTVVTLTALAVVLAWGTLYESRHGTAAAQHDIYQAWWFTVLLGVLGLNLAIAALLRWPWKRSQTGFVVTHAGIIILLLGAMLGFQFGVDGHITLREGESADHVVFEQETVRVTTPEGKVLRSITLDPERRPLPPEGRRYRLGDGLALEIQQVHPNVREMLVIEGGGVRPNPAVRVRLQSAMGGGATIQEWLLPRDPRRAAVSLMGMVELQAIEAASDAELAALTMPPGDAAPSGKGVIHIDVAGKHFDLSVAEVAGKITPLGDTGFSAEVKAYFADFRWDNEQRNPVSVSDAPNTPAVLLRITGPNTETTSFLFADHPDMSIVHGAKKESQDVKSVYRFPRPPRASQIAVVIGPGARLHYIVRGGRAPFKTGPLTVQTAVETGIADWRLEVVHWVPDATTRTELQPQPIDPADTRRFPALRVALRQGGQSSPATWVRWNSPAPLSAGDARVIVGYGWRTHPLGFTVRLKKFEAKRYEGSDMPADFRSHIVIEDNRRGITREHEVWMNNPAVYPPGWLGTRGFKFSQSSYREGREGEPNESTLGVMWDPGWPLKFIGFWTICAGIFIMYYMKTYFFGLRPRSGGAPKET